MRVQTASLALIHSNLATRVCLAIQAAEFVRVTLRTSVRAGMAEVAPGLSAKLPSTTLFLKLLAGPVVLLTVVLVLER